MRENHIMRDKFQINAHIIYTIRNQTEYMYCYDYALPTRTFLNYYSTKCTTNNNRNNTQITELYANSVSLWIYSTYIYIIKHVHKHITQYTHIYRMIFVYNIVPNFRPWLRRQWFVGPWKQYGRPVKSTLKVLKITNNQSWTNDAVWSSHVMLVFAHVRFYGFQRLHDRQPRLK